MTDRQRLSKYFPAKRDIYSKNRYVPGVYFHWQNEGRKMCVEKVMAMLGGQLYGIPKKWMITDEKGGRND
ncbi:MAG: hypothetical protein AAFZ15_25140 [Bacteroidota bacterium]